MSEELKYWYLRDHKLFWTLSMSQIKQLCIITGFKKAKKGDVIYFSVTIYKFTPNKFGYV
jgi:CRP/FNR family transcriptional regulator